MSAKELAFNRVERDGAPPPERWVLFLHGILGTGGNWRSFAKRWVDAKPGWGAVLVDLRLHGGSLGLDPPHTVRSAADDVVRLAESLPGPAEAVVGHSFGGKVALAYVDAVQGDLERAFILDSSPGTREDAHGSEDTLAILNFLERAGTFPNRTAFVDASMAEGHSRSVSQWLAMNLEKRVGGWAVKLDLPGIRALLDDYFHVDLWHVLENPPGRTRFDVVVGGRSGVLDPQERERLEEDAARMPNQLAVHVLPNAGHWLHVDDPEGTLEVLLAGA